MDLYVLNQALLAKQTEGGKYREYQQKKGSETVRQAKSAAACGPSRGFMVLKNRKPLYHKYECVEEFSII
jgi:hypothetical protein